MSQHNIRIDQELWDRAMAKARGEARTLTGVIEEALERYAPPERRPVPSRAGRPAIEGTEAHDRVPAVTLRPRKVPVPVPVPQAAFSDPPVNPLPPPAPETRRCNHPGRRVNGGWCPECQWTILPGGRFAERVR